MEPLNLPVEWATASLADINFYASSTVQPKNFPDETFELWSVPVFFSNEPEYLRGNEIGSSKQSVCPDDVLLCKINPRINRVWSVGEIKENRQIASSEWIVVRQPLMSSRYMLRYFQSGQFRVRLCSDVTGVGGSLTRAQPKKVATFPVVVPPLAEQKAIAEKLDTLLAQVESTKARLERIPKILKRFRQSVLAAAVSGKLTEEWRADKPFNPEQKIFSEIIESAQVGLVRSSKEQESFQSESHHSPYLKMNNIDNDWGVSIDELVYVRSDDVERDKYRLKVGDWLFNTRNSSELVGKSCVWKDSCECLYNNNILRIRLLCGYLPDYLEVWFRSPVGRASLESIKSATTSVAAIYQKQLLKQNVPFPDQKEQTEIVRRVDQLFAYADTIETQVNNALERVNNLTQSILAKAFRGELTEQWRKDNPDLISGENSASALLEKIKAERAAAKPVKRGRKKVK